MSKNKVLSKCVCPKKGHYASKNVLDKGYSSDDTCPIELRSLIVSLAERYGDTYVADKVAQLRHQKNVKNPCGWLRRACEQDYHQSTPADSAAIQADPDCPICHGTGWQTRMIGDTGKSMTYECDCVRRAGHKK